MSVIKIPIGDWSKDGHNQCEIFEIESNYPVLDLQEAYKASCKLTGVQFNHNQNYTGLKEHNGYGTDRHICTEYEDSYLSEEAYEIFKSFGFNNIHDDWFEEEESFDGTKHFTEVLLWFIGLSMPSDWKWSFVKNEGGYLNGFWNGNLNVQFGYGLFGN